MKTVRNVSVRRARFLTRPPKAPARCPEWYSLMQSIAQEQLAQRDDYEKLLAEAAGGRADVLQLYMRCPPSISFPGITTKASWNE